MRHETRDGALVLLPEEPLIAAREDEIAAEIAAAFAARRGCSAVLLDLSGVREIDSRGIGLIVDLNRRCREAGLELRARGLTPHLLRVFDLFQLGRLFPVEV